MCQQQLSRALWLLLVMGMLPVGYAQDAPSYARFSVEPSEPDVKYGTGAPGERFTFTADVKGARCYQLDVGDRGVEPVMISPEEVDKAVVFTHRYGEEGRYPARLKAWLDRDCGADLSTGPDPIVLDLDIRVRVPPSAPAPERPPTLPTFAEFWATPDNPRDPAGAAFTFTALVSPARCVELDFGDDGEKLEIPPGPDGRAVSSHRYQAPGSYQAVLRAWRNRDCGVDLNNEPASVIRRLEVRVAPPVPKLTASSEQWPKARRAPPVTAASPSAGGSDTLTWLMIFAALAILMSRGWAAGGTEIITFEPTRDRGRARVAGSARAEDAVSMRVRRNEIRFEVSGAAVLKAARRASSGFSGNKGERQ